MSGRPWTTADERTLRDHYPTYGPAWDGWCRHCGAELEDE